MHPILARGADWRCIWRCGRLRASCSPGCFGAPAGSTGRSRWPSRFRSPRLRVLLPVGVVRVAGVCRSRRPALSAWSATALTASCICSAAWLLLSRVWIEVLARRGAGLDARFGIQQDGRAGLLVRRPALPLVSGGQYLTAIVRTGARDRAARARGAGPGTRGRTALAARPDRSAFPVQQPALDQRADHRRRRRGATDVRAACRFSPRQPGARCSIAHSARRAS